MTKFRQRIKTLFLPLSYALCVGVIGSYSYQYFPALTVGAIFFVLSAVSAGLRAQFETHVAQHRFNQQVSDLFSTQAAVNRSASDTAAKLVKAQEGLLGLINSEQDENLSKPPSKLN